LSGTRPPARKAGGRPGILAMHDLAANHAVPAPRPRLPGARTPRRCSFVEDFNWPAPQVPTKKPRRPEVWAPGLDGWRDGDGPAVQ
jgi:hypothetical protein